MTSCDLAEVQKKKYNGSWVNLKGGGQLVTKSRDGEQMCGMVPGLGSVTVALGTARQRRHGVYGHKYMQVSYRYAPINR